MQQAASLPSSQRSYVLADCLQVWGNLGAFLERLDDEWNSSLKVRSLSSSTGTAALRARARWSLAAAHVCMWSLFGQNLVAVLILAFDAGPGPPCK